MPRARQGCPSSSGGHVRGTLLGERGLGRSQPRQGHAVRGTAHVVKAEAVAEGDRLRLASVLSADAELELVLRRAAPLGCDPHQLPNPALVEGLEWVSFEHAVLEIAGEELALGVVTREAERRLG